MSAFDGDVGTSWFPAARPSVVGEWLQVDLPAAALTTVAVTPTPRRSVYEGRITAVDVSTEAGTVRVALGEDGPVTATLPAGSTSWLRVTVASEEGGRAGISGSGIAEVDVAGVGVRRLLATPADLPGTVRDRVPLVVLDRGVADPYDPSRRDEESFLARRVTLTAGGTFAITGEALAAPGPSLDRLLDGLTEADRGSVSEIARGHAKTR